MKQLPKVEELIENVVLRDSAAAFKSDGYGLESLLAGYQDRGSVQSKGTQHVNV